MGLVATRNIIRGTNILSEEVMVTRHTLENSRSILQYNSHLAAALRAVQDKTFAGRFAQLPHCSAEQWGPFAAFFQRGCIPGLINDHKVRFLGIDSSFLNHGCAANAETHIVTNVVDGKMTCVLHVYACSNIDAGDEITAPYIRLYAEIRERRRHIHAQFGFNCECKHCVERSIPVEYGMMRAGQEMPKLGSRWRTEDEPANVLQVAYLMKNIHLESRIQDNRYPEIYERCAIICGYHFDVGRALEFLERARLVYIMNQGKNGPDTKRMVRYLINPTRLPFFGTTMRGLSSADEMSMFHHCCGIDDEILFMIGLKPGQYLRLCDVAQYHKLKHLEKQEERAERARAKEAAEERAQREAMKIEEVDDAKEDVDEKGTTPESLANRVSELKLQDDQVIRQEQENQANGQIGM